MHPLLCSTRGLQTSSDKMEAEVEAEVSACLENLQSVSVARWDPLDPEILGNPSSSLSELLRSLHLQLEIL